MGFVIYGVKGSATWTKDKESLIYDLFITHGDDLKRDNRRLVE